MHHGSSFAYDDSGNFLECTMGHILLTMMVVLSWNAPWVIFCLQWSWYFPWNAPWVIFCLRWWWYFPGMHHGSSFAYDDSGTFLECTMGHLLLTMMVVLSWNVPWVMFCLRWWWYFPWMHHGSSFAYDDGGNFLECNIGHLLHHGHHKTIRGRGCVTKQAIHSPISCLVMALLFSQRSLNRPASCPSPSRTHRKFRTFPGQARLSPAHVSELSISWPT